MMMMTMTTNKIKMLPLAVSLLLAACSKRGTEVSITPGETAQGSVLAEGESDSRIDAV